MDKPILKHLTASWRQYAKTGMLWAVRCYLPNTFLEHIANKICFSLSLVMKLFPWGCFWHVSLLCPPGELRCPLVHFRTQSSGISLLLGSEPVFVRICWASDSSFPAEIELIPSEMWSWRRDEFWDICLFLWQIFRCLQESLLDVPILRDAVAPQQWLWPVTLLTLCSQCELTKSFHTLFSTKYKIALPILLLIHKGKKKDFSKQSFWISAFSWFRNEDLCYQNTHPASSPPQELAKGMSCAWLVPHCSPTSRKTRLDLARVGVGVVLTSQYLCGIFKCCGDSFSTSWPPKDAGGLLRAALPLIHWWWSWLALKSAHLPSHHLLRWKLSAASGLLAENFQLLLSQPFWGLKCRDISLAEVHIGKCGQMPWRYPSLQCCWYLFLHVWTESV